MLLLVFPNQLFELHPGLELTPTRIVLLEDSLFFGDAHYPMHLHRQKLWLHRASMKHYEADLRQRGFNVQYVEYDATKTLDIQLSQVLSVEDSPSQRICWIDPHDFILTKRLRQACNRLKLQYEVLANPGFLNLIEDNRSYRSEKSSWFMADFYKWQRRRLDILMVDGEPLGGKWSYDNDNRKKVPKQRLESLPEMWLPKSDAIDQAAKKYIEQNFPDNPGHLDHQYYATTHASARSNLEHFLHHRFRLFGDFEDAIEQGQAWLWHSVLTPALNIGLLTPAEVVSTTLKYAELHEIPINSLEGFLRQVIGWREFVRATYDDLSVSMRTTNYWQHQRSMPSSFYSGTTGILPFDDTIERVLATGYCHHIERLMVLGGFMFLCEIDPDDIYRWFMEMFVDSYDWVMVPNVYAMSQNADGGSITTKPYFSGSSYIRKMSHYKPGTWCEVWDGLYWRWIWNHADVLVQNPRWAMMCRMVQRMDPHKRSQHLATAESFLAQLA